MSRVTSTSGIVLRSAIIMLVCFLGLDSVRHCGAPGSPAVGSRKPSVFPAFPVFFGLPRRLGDKVWGVRSAALAALEHMAARVFRPFSFAVQNQQFQIKLLRAPDDPTVKYAG